MLREAVAACEQGTTLSGRESFATGLLAHAYAVAGNRPKAQAVLQELETRRRSEYVSSLGIALAHLGAGDADGALAWLDSAIEAHDPRVLESIGEPIWAPLKDDPRLTRVRRRLNLWP
jgi:hypothetical protein